MYIQLSKNSFIRCTPNYGYITNQLTRQDRVYNESGASFLKKIARKPLKLENIVGQLCDEYPDELKETIEKDFVSFIEDLANHGFVILGDSIDDLAKKEQEFSYSIDAPFTMTEDFTQQTQERVSENTQDFFLEEVQKRPMISALQFELSSRCNERCIHCYIPNDKKNKGFDMPTQEVKRVLDEFSDMGGLYVTLSGGEAFLHNDILEIIEYCRKKDFRVTILSNLISVKEEHVQALKKMNVSLIQTSLYSMNPEIHDYITTVKGSFERTKSSIEKLVKSDIPVQISCPVMKANKDSIRDVLLYARSLKIKAQTDYIMMARSDLDTSNLANRLSLEETEKVIQDILQFDADYIDNTLMQKPLSDEVKFNMDRFKSQPVCGVGYDNCCITANGDVYPCAGWQDYVIGNVYRQPLKEIWEGSKKVQALRKITQASFPSCLNCEALNYCNRCLVRNYNETNGNMFEIPKRFCDIAFLNKKLTEKFEHDYIYKK